MQDIVDDYKNANLTISKNCKKISEMLLVKIDGKRVYDNLEFEDEQVTKLIFPLNNNILFYVQWILEVCHSTEGQPMFNF